MRIFHFGFILALLSAPPALAQVDYIIPEPFYEEGSYIDLRMVRASGDGVVRVFDRASGRLLAEASVHAGANPDVRLRFRAELFRSAKAVLFVGGRPVAERNLMVVDELPRGFGN